MRETGLSGTVYDFFFLLFTIEKEDLLNITLIFNKKE